jgi:hypothetical protein
MAKPRKKSTPLDQSKKSLLAKIKRPIPVETFPVESFEEMLKAAKDEKLDLVYALHDIPPDAEDKKERLFLKLLSDRYCVFEPIAEKTHRGRHGDREAERRRRLLEAFEVFEREYNHKSVKGDKLRSKFLAAHDGEYEGFKDVGTIRNALPRARRERALAKWWDYLKSYQAREVTRDRPWWAGAPRGFRK